MPATIDIRGPIVPDDEKWFYDWLDMNAVCPADVRTALDTADGQEVLVQFNSPGGEVSSGSEIYTMLRSYGGEVKGEITGLAASAASVIAMACDSLAISPTAQFMIHKAWTFTAGNEDDHAQTQSRLQSVDEGVVSAYMHKTGKPKQELLDMMGAETWLNAEQAKSSGFVDSIMFEETPEPIAVIAASAGGLLSKQAKDAVRAAAAAAHEKQQAPVEPEKPASPVTAADLQQMKTEILQQLQQANPAEFPAEPEAPERTALQRLFTS